MAAADDQFAFRRVISRSTLRMSIVVLAAAAFVVSLAGRQTSNAAEEQAKPMQIGDIDYAAKSPPSKSGYVPVNGLEMYYEVHGSGGTPLVLVHGASRRSERRSESSCRTSPGAGRSSPSSCRDTATPPTSTARCRWSRWLTMSRRRCRNSASRRPTSSATAWAAASPCVSPSNTRSASASSCFSIGYNRAGLPGFWEGMANFKPEMMKGTPWYEEYQRIAPKPGDFAGPVRQEDRNGPPGQGPAGGRDQGAPPTLIMMGDLDTCGPNTRSRCSVFSAAASSATSWAFPLRNSRSFPDHRTP